MIHSKFWNCRIVGFAMVACMLAACGRSGSTASDAHSAGKHEANTAQLEADVRFLASDVLEGREAGTRGYDIAAQYVAERFRALGLQPGGDGQTYFQGVPMRAFKSAIDHGGRLEFVGGAKSQVLTPGADYVVIGSTQQASNTIEAEVVFVGFGIVADRHQRDDYAGLDVKGKIVARYFGAPKFLQTEERAYFADRGFATASAHGAIGVIMLSTPTFANVMPYEQVVELFKHQTTMGWRDAEGKVFTRAPNIKGGALLSRAGTEKLFAKSAKPWTELEAIAESDKGEVQGFPLNVKVRISYRATTRELNSSNVIAILPGSDPQLKNEHVVITAHLDHDGIKPTPDPSDDELFNGAMDNAVGMASMLEVARLLKDHPPRRSVLFLATTAEEKGLVGAEYFARNPTIPRERIVANVNLDMPIMTYDFTDVVAFGAERSTLEAAMRSAVAQAALTLSPDPMPEQGMFTRSDQFTFVEQGVPAVYLQAGWGGDGKEAQQDFLKKHYHRPSDQPDVVRFPALAKFSVVNFLIVKGIADMNDRPRWKKGDFFGEVFKGPMEK